MKMAKKSKKQTDQLAPFTGSMLVLVTIALGLGTFIQVLDSSIANVALPTIAGDLGVSSDIGTWVITSFSASNAVVLPLTGWLSKRFGSVRVFAISTLLFSCASWLCGLAPSIELLVFFRALQGAVAGSLIPLSQSLLLMNYPESKRGMALAFWAMIVITAPVLGPILGGWITENYGWGWIFYINIPLGFLSAFLSWNLLKKRDNPTRKEPLDLFGFALLVFGVITLQICCDQGQQRDWFASDRIRLLATLSFLSFSAFFVWEAYCPHPIVDLSFFKRPNFRLGLLASTLAFVMFFGSMVLLPLWLQNFHDYTSSWSGIATAPIGLASLFLSPLVGMLLYRIDLRIFPLISFCIFSFSFFWFSHLNTDAGLWQIIEPRLVQGIAVACFFTPLVSLSMLGIAKEQLPSASGLFNFIRVLFGGGIGTSLFVAFYNQRLFWHQSYLLDAINPFSYRLAQFQSDVEPLAQGGGDSLYGMIEQIAMTQSSILALNDIFTFCGYAFLVLIPLLWWCKPLSTTQTDPIDPAQLVNH